MAVRYLSPNLSSSTVTPWWIVIFFSGFQALAYLVLALFPDGRFTPRWMLWPTLGLIGSTLLESFVPNPQSVTPNLIVQAVIGSIPLALFVCLCGGVVYRYVRVATPLQRQQIKWLVFVLVIDVVLNWIGPVVLGLLFPTVFYPGSLPYALYQLLWPLTALGLPLSIAIAMLRYRLWDIDILINRTLVYGTLTALLVLVYALLVLGLQSLVSSIAGQALQSPLVIVGSTLAIAALFQPLRRRIQRIIDRRFYRRKYDAAQTLAAFSATLRNEVDLSELHEHLLAVVQETMQPAHVSLWLREVNQERRQNTRM